MPKQSSGFTVLEVVLTLAIVVTIFLAVMGTYIGLAGLTEASRNTTRAMADAQVVLERIRNSSATNLATVTGTNWTTWAVNPGGLTSLTNEVVTVSYLPGGANADPLNVTVTVTWLERGHNKQVAVNTLLTQRS